MTETPLFTAASDMQNTVNNQFTFADFSITDVIKVARELLIGKASCIDDIFMLMARKLAAVIAPVLKNF